VLADGFSCRTQLDQLAGVSGTHLAQLLASRLADPHARLPGYLMAWTCVVWATSRSAASYTLVWAVTVVRPRCSLVEGQAELPGERHQRHEGVQISGHDRRLQSTCIRRPAEPSGPMPGE
jgi:hypothetical protein